MLFSLIWKDFSDFLLVDKGRSRNPTAIYADRSRFNTIAEWFQGKEWNTLNFRALIAHKQIGCKNGTINKLITMGGLIDEDLATSVTSTFKTTKEEIAVLKDLLNHDDVVKLAELQVPYGKFFHVLNKRNKVLIYFLWATGCRIGEALSLPWDEIHSNPYHVTIRHTKNKADRDVPIGQSLYDMIMALPRDGGIVFPSVRGVNLKCQEINADLKRRALLCGVKKRVWCHLFRHSCASELKRRGVADSDICKILGWTDPKMLLRYDNNRLDYYADVMSVHPMNLINMSYDNKVQKVIKEASKWFTISQMKMASNPITGKITIELCD